MVRGCINFENGIPQYKIGETAAEFQCGAGMTQKQCTWTNGCSACGTGYILTPHNPAICRIKLVDLSLTWAQTQTTSLNQECGLETVAIMFSYWESNHDYRIGCHSAQVHVNVLISGVEVIVEDTFVFTCDFTFAAETAVNLSHRVHWANV